MVDLHQERFRVVEDVPLNPFGDASERVVGQRPFHVDELALLLGQEDRVAWEGEVDALRSRPPGLLAGLELDGVAVGGFRPDDRIAISPGDQEEAETSGRGAVVGGVHGPPLNLVAESLQASNPLLEGVASLVGVGV